MKNRNLIDGYLQKNLSNEDLVLFEESLINDPDFGKEFQEVKQIQLNIKILIRKDVKSFLNKIEEDIQQNKLTQNYYTMKRVVSVAASLVLIAIISFFSLNQSIQPSHKDIYTDNFSHYENLSGQVREQLDTQVLKVRRPKPMMWVTFPLAAATYAELVKTDKSANNYFYMGLSNLESGNYEEAISNLNATVNNFDAFDKQAKWYLSLAHFANDNEDAAIATLISLTIENSVYKEKAETILSEMGLSLNSYHHGIIYDVKKRPPHDSPNGNNAEFEDARQWQFGVVISETDGLKYRFLTDELIDGLESGSEVEMIIARERQ